MTPLTLWLKCGSEADRMCGDPFAHHLFLRMLLHSAKNQGFKFVVKAFNENKPPREFREAGLRKSPALQTSEDEGVSHEDDILEFLDQFEPKDTTSEFLEAEDEICDLFKKFAWYIKKVNEDPKSLNTELLRLDRFLEEKGKKFLISDQMGLLDCLLLPRIHTIRIAGKALKNFSIPSELVHVWAYLNNGYADKNFRTSCPSDQEIILYWADKPETPTLPFNVKNALSKGEPRHTFTV